MRKFLQYCIVLTLLVPSFAGAQDGFSDRAKKYVEEYASLAMYEQRKNGVPAAVTLGQGILETEAGISELMTEANNHFGIKCKNGWQGETFTHTDDAPDECFKKYKCAADSYRDHSEHLKRNPRYAPLFKIKEQDYKGWAVCLKKCGYATNPQYAQRLIKIIEDYGLQQYTYSAFDSAILNNYTTNPVANVQSSEATAMPVLPNAAYAKSRSEDTLPPAAKRLHVVREGETVASIAAMEGIDLVKLMTLNLLHPNEEPVAGAVLQLITQAKQKPSVKTNTVVAHTGNAIVSGDEKPGQNSDYIAINKKQKAADSPRAKTSTPPAEVKTKTEEVPANMISQVTGKPIAAENIIYVTDSKRPKPPPPPKTEEELAIEKKDKELANLKAELDKIVYADDSKLIAQNTAAPAPEKKPVAETAATRGANVYTVKKGDTAFSIAKKNNITLEQLLKMNNMEAGDVKIGQTLKVKE